MNVIFRNFVSDNFIYSIYKGIPRIVCKYDSIVIVRALKLSIYIQDDVDDYALLLKTPEGARGPDRMEFRRGSPVYACDARVMVTKI